MKVNKITFVINTFTVHSKLFFFKYCINIVTLCNVAYYLMIKINEIKKNGVHYMTRHFSLPLADASPPSLTTFSFFFLPFPSTCKDTFLFFSIFRSSWNRNDNYKINRSNDILDPRLKWFILKINKTSCLGWKKVTIFWKNRKIYFCKPIQKAWCSQKWTKMYITTVVDVTEKHTSE